MFSKKRLVSLSLLCWKNTQRTPNPKNWIGLILWCFRRLCRSRRPSRMTPTATPTCRRRPPTCPRTTRPPSSPQMAPPPSCSSSQTPHSCSSSCRKFIRDWALNKSSFRAWKNPKYSSFIDIYIAALLVKVWFLYYIILRACQRI